MSCYEMHVLDNAGLACWLDDRGGDVGLRRGEAYDARVRSSKFYPAKNVVDFPQPLTSHKTSVPED